MDRRLLTKIDLYVMVWGTAICLGSLFWRDLPVFIGALVGAVLATANWIGFRWAGVRMAATGNKSRFGVFLAVKTLVVMAAVVLVLTVFARSVSPIAFMIGISSLVLGILSRGAHQALIEGGAALREDG